MKEFDVCIVGCGAAGNTLAYHLAKAGITVALFEKAKLPRVKTCAGGVSKKAIELIGYSISGAVERVIHSSYLTYKNEIVTHKTIKGIGVTTKREELDLLMTRKAVGEGAELFEGTTVKCYEEQTKAVVIKTNRGEFRGKVLAAADGVHSRIRAQMLPGVDILKGIAVEALVFPKDLKVLESFGDNTLFDFGGVRGGYGWIFPKRDHFNAGLFTSRKKTKDLRSELETFLNHYGVLRERSRIEVRGWPIPRKPVGKRLNTNRVLLLGDAAGFGESFYGEGIYFAVWSSRLAEVAIKDYITDRKGLDAYSKAVRVIRRDLFFRDLPQRFFTRCHDLAIITWFVISG